jgi:hypothetical protein
MTGKFNMITREQLAAEYLDYVCNYLTIEKWGEHHGLSNTEAFAFYSVCRSAYYNLHPDN